MFDGVSGYVLAGFRGPVDISSPVHFMDEVAFLFEAMEQGPDSGFLQRTRRFSEGRPAVISGAARISPDIVHHLLFELAKSSSHDDRYKL